MLRRARTVKQDSNANAVEVIQGMAAGCRAVAGVAEGNMQAALLQRRKHLPKTPALLLGACVTFSKGLFIGARKMRKCALQKQVRKAPTRKSAETVAPISASL